MKKILFYSFVLALVLATGQNSFAQRNVFWVHGINSSSGWWEKYDEIFDLRADLRSVNVDFRDDEESMADMVDAITTRIGAGNQRVAVGHSMGGSCP